MKLVGAREVPVVEDLSNTERALLRELFQPGAALWKIVRSMVDYGEGLKDALLTADLSDKEDRRSAAKAQATIIAVQWVKETFEQALADPTELETPLEDVEMPDV